MTDDTQPTAEIVPFPLSRTQSWRNIAQTYAGRPWNGRYGKAAYAEGVITNNIERLQRLGVSQSRIDAEVASLHRLFAALSQPDAPEKVRA